MKIKRFISLRLKLIFSFLLVVIFSGILTTWVGVNLVGDRILRQAQDKVRIDLNSAREIYNNNIADIKDVIRLTASRFFIRGGISQNDISSISDELIKIRQREALDILTITDREGLVLYRTTNPQAAGDSSAFKDLLHCVISKHTSVSSTEIVTSEDLYSESAELARQAHIEVIPTPKARSKISGVEKRGMMMIAAAPILDPNGALLGVLYGGKLLNRHYEIVDKIKETVYQGEVYKGKDIGTATIFQGDLRISTNVKREDGSRAIGTQVSEEVAEQVLIKGLPWIERAFVVNNWYITAYEPIRDIDNNIIGILYVGMLEAPYVDLRNSVVVTFILISIATILFLSVVAYIISLNITKPIDKLVVATQQVANGDLSHRVFISTRDEMGLLGESFNQMTEELQKVTARYISLSQTLEQKVKEKTAALRKAQDQLVQSEKLLSLGKLAAGIAHEINNPLTSILINSHLIAEKTSCNDACVDSVNLIVAETTRCSTIVQGLLDFARQNPPAKKLADINDVITSTLMLLNSQILVNNVRVEKKLDTSLPPLLIDSDKIKQVFTNIIINAIDSMPDGGKLDVASASVNNFTEVTFRDTGSGIAEENLNSIFDPFFSTKGTRGTGLGLAISYGIIQQHGGTISVDSEIGFGTTMIIRLPVKDKTT